MSKPYEGATHKIGDDYYAKDIYGRWCCVDENGDAWPVNSNYHDEIEIDAVPLGLVVDNLQK